MPLFEFVCLDCDNGRRFSALVGVVATAKPPVCPRCGGERLRKCVSRFARVRSEDQTLDDLTDAADSLDENDPQAMRRFVREMAAGMDGDVGADELEALVDEEASGAGAGEDTEDL